MPRNFVLIVATLLLAVGRGAAGEAPPADVDAVVSLLEFVIDVDEDTARKCLATLRAKVQSGEVSGDRLAAIRAKLGGQLGQLVDGGGDAGLYYDAALLAGSWGDERALKVLLEVVRDPRQEAGRRRAAIEAAAAAGSDKLLDAAPDLLAGDADAPQLAATLLASLARYREGRVADVVLQAYAELADDNQPRAVELLTQRTEWSKALVEAIGRGQVPAHALNVNQVTRLLASRDAELVRLVRAKWGSVRTERNPQREQVLVEMRRLLGGTPGDPHKGQQVFQKVCGQCHKIYGQGQEVGPDITRNGRASYEQLLSNVFDPSLVIGAAYQARTVVTVDGRVLTGLVSEDNSRRLVLKLQGGKLEILPREQIDEVQVSQLSLMPEGLEKQLLPRELADLFAFLALDGPPADPAAALIPGAPQPGGSP